MDPKPQTDVRYWRAYPVRAGLLRFSVFVFPILVSIAAGIVVSHLLPTPHSIPQLIGWWVVVLLVSTIAVIAADKLARRVLPLATLLQLSMLFPDRAPSRLKVARRASGSKAIAAELERAHHHGVTGDRQEAAETILALVGALGDYDSRTRGHSERTQLYVTMLADELGLKVEDRGRLMWAALIHDIGKLKVPHEVLNKPSKPTEEEWHILHSHPMQGAQICEPLREWLGDWWLAIEQHHEQFDGSGYPRGLAGKQISYGARIVSVADCYEVMTASRPYKRPMTAVAAREELIRCAGTQFDPEVVRAFLNISLGGMNRYAGPLAWIAQFLLIRPGPLLGQALGASTGAVAAAASVAALSLAPIAANGSVLGAHEAPGSSNAALGTPTPGDSTPTTTAPTGSAPTTPVPPTGSPSGPTAQPTTPSSTRGPTTHGPTGPTGTTPGVETMLWPDTLSTAEDQPGSVNVLSNDAVANGDSLTIVATAGAAHGATTIGSDGSVRYVPATDFHGSDSFSYTAEDDEGVTLTASVTVSVESVDDPPTVTDDSVTLGEDADATRLDLLANDHDVDGDSLTVTSVSGAAHGALASSAGGFTYAPSADFHGSDFVTYTVSDGHGRTDTARVDVTVTSVNDPPVAGPAAYSATVAHQLSVSAANGVLANASDVDGDKLTVVSDDSVAVQIASNGAISYLPVLSGTVRVHYVISDGRATASGTVTITVALLAAGTTRLYLQPTDTDNTGELDTSAPSGGISDWDGDGDPGLTVKSSDLKASEDDDRKFQVWSYPVPQGGLTLSGPITMDLWTSLENRANEDLDWAAWVLDCDPSDNCTHIAQAVGVHVRDWSTKSTWEKREITIGSANATIPKDDTLQIRLMFHGRDVWMPLDGNHASSITITN